MRLLQRASQHSALRSDEVLVFRQRDLLHLAANPAVGMVPAPYLKFSRFFENSVFAMNPPIHAPIMVGTPAIRNLIREAKVAQMYSAIQTGQQYGMQTLDQNLADLVKRNVISTEEARTKAANKDNFK